MENNIKIIIIGMPDIDKREYAQEIINLLPDLSLSNTFSTNMEEYENKVCGEYIDSKTLSIAYKNNALLYVNTNNSISRGLTLDEYYSTNISVIDIYDFNLISDCLLSNENLLVCWIDESKKQNMIENYLEEIEVLENRIYKLNYLYFLNISTKEFAEVIKRYILETNEEIKKEIREEYS